MLCCNKTKQPIMPSFVLYIVVVYQSSETSTNQSDVIIRSDDRFLNLVVDSDSIVSKICMLNYSTVLFLILRDTEKIKKTFPLNLYRQIQGLFCVVYRRCIAQTLV
jgi:hypothetical protein